MSALPEEAVSSVTGLVNRLRTCLEKNFSYVLVRGEITDFSLAPSGHIYFSLKDDSSQIKCAWFQGNQRAKGQLFDPLTGEVFETPRPDPRQYLANGLEAICAGMITFYNGGGICQLSIDFVELAGAGALAQAFEMLKSRLAGLGYFAKEHKKALPPNPRKIALITSPHGAAVHDFLEMARSRGLSAKIRLFPVPVQGKGAAEKIAWAIGQAATQNWAEVIVVIRGGGALEDLWSFNEEVVCKAIFNSPVPVLTGIGHEIDTSLADLAADVRAATPTHAAQLLWPLRREMWQNLDIASMRLETSLTNFINSINASLTRHERFLALLSPKEKVRNKWLALERLQRHISQSFRHILTEKENTSKHAAYVLRNRSPASALQERMDRVNMLYALVGERCRHLVSIKASQLDRLENSLTPVMETLIKKLFTHLEIQEAKIETLNPENLLKKGYALIFSHHRPVYSIQECKPEQEITIRLFDGFIYARIEKTQNKEC